MTREECRKKAVADLEAQGYLVKIEDYAHNVGDLLSLPYDGRTDHLQASGSST